MRNLKLTIDQLRHACNYDQLWLLMNSRFLHIFTEHTSDSAHVTALFADVPFNMGINLISNQELYNYAFTLLKARNFDETYIRSVMLSHWPLIKHTNA